MVVFDGLTVTVAPLWIGPTFWSITPVPLLKLAVSVVDPPAEILLLAAVSDVVIEGAATTATATLAVIAAPMELVTVSV